MPALAARDVDGRPAGDAVQPRCQDDGTQQLALGDQPLYRYTGDANPGDANGNGVGDVWSVVDADQVDAAAAGGRTKGGGYGDRSDAAAVLSVGDTDLGPALIDADGRTLYAFLDDVDGQSNCNDACAQAWPPVAGDVDTDSAVTGGTTTIARGDGSSQLAIDGRPLYRFSGDQAPGDTNGQGSGDVWFVLAPDGELYR